MDEKDEQQTQPIEERIHVKSPVSVTGALRTSIELSNVVTEILDLLGSKGVTFENALLVLDKTREALHKCTVLQTKYTP